jgi:hypothetical protein
MRRKNHNVGQSRIALILPLVRRIAAEPDCDPPPPVNRNAPE